MQLRDRAIAILGGLLVALTIALGLRLGVISSLKENKDSISALSDVLTILALIIGAILAYLTFFRGHEYSQRADLGLSVIVIEGPDEDLLHSIIITIKTVGRVALEEPTILLTATPWKAEGETDPLTVNVTVPDLPKGSFLSVDPGETSRFIAQRFFGTEVWAVTYKVMVSLNKRQWHDYIVVQNAPSAKAPTTALGYGDDSTTLRA